MFVAKNTPKLLKTFSGSTKGIMKFAKSNGIDTTEIEDEIESMGIDDGTMRNVLVLVVFLVTCSLLSGCAAPLVASAVGGATLAKKADIDLPEIVG